MNDKKRLLVVTCVVSLLLFPSLCFSAEVKLLSKSLGEACVSEPPVITSKAGEFIQKDRDSLGMMIASCVSERLNREGLSWQMTPDELNDRITRNFKTKLMGKNEPVDSISYATAELAGPLKAKSIVVIYSYIDMNRSGGMKASGKPSKGGEGIGNMTLILFGNNITNSDDDIYLYCSVYDVQSRKAVMAKRRAISKKGKSSNTACKKEVQEFVESLFQ